MWYQNSNECCSRCGLYWTLLGEKFNRRIFQIECFVQNLPRAVFFSCRTRKSFSYLSKPCAYFFIKQLVRNSHCCRCMFLLCFDYFGWYYCNHKNSWMPSSNIAFHTSKNPFSVGLRYCNITLKLQSRLEASIIDINLQNRLIQDSLIKSLSNWRNPVDLKLRCL